MSTEHVLNTSLTASAKGVLPAVLENAQCSTVNNVHTVFKTHSGRHLKFHNYSTACSPPSPPGALSRFPNPPILFLIPLKKGGDAAAGSLGLPIGALFAPFARLQPPPAEIPRQPILCTHCAAYPNPFSTVDPATGGWRCCFCTKNNPCYAEDFIGSSPSEHRESYPGKQGQGNIAVGVVEKWQPCH